MKTQGEIEAAICVAISRFEQETRGRGPKEIHAYLSGDVIVIRLQGLLTLGEQQLAKIPFEKGRDLLKQVRTHLIESAKPFLQTMIQEITGVKVLSLHHDISTSTGEEVVLFTLAESLGAVESLIEHPGRMTHAVLAESPLAVDGRLIRLSVGIENIDDLLADLDRAFRG